MSNHLTGARRVEQHQRRLAWLQAHPELLARLPGMANDVSDAQSEALNEALRGMKLVKLYAPTSDNQASRWSIRVLVSELRGRVTGRAEPRI